MLPLAYSTKTPSNLYLNNNSDHKSFERVPGRVTSSMLAGVSPIKQSHNSYDYFPCVWKSEIQKPNLADVRLRLVWTRRNALLSLGGISSYLTSGLIKESDQINETQESI